MYCTVYVLQLTGYLIWREKVARHVFHLRIPKIRIVSVMILCSRHCKVLP
jgi:hypothetical protein